MTTDDLPLKVSACSDRADGSIFAPPPLDAIDAAPIVTAAPENAFEKRTRTRRPPMLARTIIRTVWLLSDGRIGGMGKRRPGNAGAADGTAGAAAAGAGLPRPGSPTPRTSACPAPHVATQCPPGGGDAGGRAWPATSTSEPQIDASVTTMSR